MEVHLARCSPKVRAKDFYIPSGNRDPETGITPMDNFVCWRCQSKARGAFILMGKPAEKWLTERQHQIELALADSSLVISQFNGASARLRHCRNKRYAQNGSEKHFNKAITESSRRASLRKILMPQPDFSKTAQQSA